VNISRAISSVSFLVTIFDWIQSKYNLMNK
jgi:hypothetical protein